MAKRTLPSSPKKYESKKLSSAEAKEIHDDAMRLADEAWTAERENIRQGRDCQRFYAGDQWDEKAKKGREADGRPVLTINRLPQFVRQMTGDLRKSPPSLKFLPAKGKASQETAEALTGIARHIEQQSNAKDCYIIATENAAVASQGFFRVVTEYSSDDGFEQDIRIRPIRDPFGALLDPFAQLPDKSDTRYGFVFEHLSKEDFKAAYPNASADSMPIAEAAAFPWRVGDTIRIAEFWKRKPVKKTLILLDDGQTVEDETKIPEEMVETNRREVETYEVCSYLISGKEILSGPHPWAGRFIPICAVVGEEITSDGTTIRKGMVHDARDPQRIYNYSRSASVEAVALQPKAPFIATVDQIKGFESVWRTAGSKNHAVLTYNADPRAPGPPTRSQPAIASTGLDVQAGIAAEDMKAVTGIYDASLGSRSNETSGVAIAQRQQEVDTAAYLYPDNLSRALGYCGRILADLIPRVMDTERQVRILKEDGGTEMITVNPAEPPPPDAKGKPAPIYDLSSGEYDVVVVTGPSFASRRAESAAHMIDLAKGVPMVGQVAPDLIVENMDFPGADKIAKRIKQAMGIGEDGEKVDQGQAPPDPATAAKAMKDAASVDKIKAETDKIELENAQLAANLATVAQALPQIMAVMQQITQGQAPQPGGPPPEGMQPPQGAMPPEMTAPPGMPPQGAPEPPPLPGDDLPMIEVEAIEGAPA